MSCITRSDFSPVHAVMREAVDADLLSGVSSAVLHGRELVDLHCEGMADREAGVPLRADHLFRIFSNTKLVTSCAVMMLWEEGRIDLDDAIESFIPQLGERRVLRPGATRIDDTEPARSSNALNGRLVGVRSGGPTHRVARLSPPASPRWSAAGARAPARGLRCGGSRRDSPPP